MIAVIFEVEPHEGAAPIADEAPNALRAAIPGVLLFAADGWTVVTKDHSLSAQWEHMVLVTDDGVEVLTLRDGERRP